MQKNAQKTEVEGIEIISFAATKTTVKEWSASRPTEANRRHSYLLKEALFRVPPLLLVMVTSGRISTLV